ncbi:hypothetical protein WJX84_001025 [Apatococcus fuscideae]|uniref:Uncharacterized protein n=1 Tax=Apatococcus fuscideae TaxID=2026836 RepID=A0AAW1SIS3_9CHLO
MANVEVLPPKQGDWARSPVCGSPVSVLDPICPAVYQAPVKLFGKSCISYMGHPSGRDVARLYMLIRRMTTSLLGQEAEGDSFPGFRESFVLAFEELFAQVAGYRDGAWGGIASPSRAALAEENEVLRSHLANLGWSHEMMETTNVRTSRSGNATTLASRLSTPSQGGMGSPGHVARQIGIFGSAGLNSKALGLPLTIDDDVTDSMGGGGLIPAVHATPAGRPAARGKVLSPIEATMAVSGGRSASGSLMGNWSEAPVPNALPIPSPHTSTSRLGLVNTAVAARSAFVGNDKAVEEGIDVSQALSTISEIATRISESSGVAPDQIDVWVNLALVYSTAKDISSEQGSSTELHSIALATASVWVETPFH